MALAAISVVFVSEDLSFDTTDFIQYYPYLESELLKISFTFDLALIFDSSSITLANEATAAAISAKSSEYPKTGVKSGMASIRIPPLVKHQLT